MIIRSYWTLTSAASCCTGIVQRGLSLLPDVEIAGKIILLSDPSSPSLWHVNPVEEEVARLPQHKNTTKKKLHTVPPSKIQKGRIITCLPPTQRKKDIRYRLWKTLNPHIGSFKYLLRATGLPINNLLGSYIIFKLSGPTSSDKKLRRPSGSASKEITTQKKPMKITSLKGVSRILFDGDFCRFRSWIGCSPRLVLGKRFGSFVTGNSWKAGILNTFFTWVQLGFYNVLASRYYEEDTAIAAFSPAKGPCP